METITKTIQRMQNLSVRPTNSLTRQQESRITRTRCLFSTPEQLMAKASPDAQKAFAQKPERAVTGDYPTLTDLRLTYGRNAAEQWMYVQIADMTVYTGARNLNKRQQEQLADGICAEYHWLKITEVLLFFHRFKMGRYGRFYGSVDPMVVTCALRQFIAERNEILAQYEQQQREKRQREYDRTHPVMTREEWLEVKTIIAMYNADYTI